MGEHYDAIYFKYILNIVYSIITMQFQRCPSCDQDRPITEFAPNSRGILYPICNSISCRPMDTRRKDEILYEMAQYQQTCLKQYREIDNLKTQIHDLIAARQALERHAVVLKRRADDRIFELSDLLENEVFKVVNLENDNDELTRESKHIYM